MAIRGAAADREIGKIIAAAQRASLKNQFLAKATKGMADAALGVAEQNAQAGKNVQGRPWKRLKKGGGVALRWMASSLGVEVRDVQFEVKSDKPWAGYHQKGAKARAVEGPALPGKKRQTGRWRLPRRTVLPKRGMPKPWRAKLAIAMNGVWYANWK
jgi:hypothetical protein